MQQLGKYKEKLSSLNHWKLATFILFFILVISLFTYGFTSFFKPSPVMKKDAEMKFINYIEKNIITNKDIEVIKISRLNDLYEVELKINNNCFKSYMTRDGIYIFPQGFDTRKSPGAPQPETCS